MAAGIAAQSGTGGHFRLRLRTILLLINLVVLVLPLGGIFALRIYESALIRQTESELIAQGAVIASAYQITYASLTQRHEPHGRSDALPDYGNPLRYHALPAPGGGPPEHRRAQLDLADARIDAPVPDALPGGGPADPLAQNIGRELTPMLRGAQTYTLAGIRVVDFRGIVVATTSEDLGGALTNREEVMRALAGEPVSLLRWRGSDTPTMLESLSRGSHVQVVVAQPIVHDGHVLGAVLLVRTPANIKQALLGKRSALLRGALLLLTAVLLLSLLTSLTISRPVQALIEQARRAARGERGAVTPLRRAGTREIHELSETIAAMAATLESRAAYIRDFAAHVSHEFKTPLTSMQGAVELLREHGAGMSETERERFLGMVAADASRLERLVRRLLELARADVLQPRQEVATVAAVVDAVAQRQRELGLAISVDNQAGAARVPVAADILDSILGTLCDNARQHAGPQPQVSIRCRTEPAAKQLVIEFGDNGSGISPGNAAKVFEPFFTTARERGGTGLGLSITRSLLAAYGGGIELLPAERGALFRITLPLVLEPTL
ncbi:MAG: HAMP domain-containing sensor histidine kinase [Nevskia sp.]|nr:HAMP domain-containing sensor histidine kinase [Nevskia sp.]